MAAPHRARAHPFFPVYIAASPINANPVRTLLRNRLARTQAIAPACGIASAASTRAAHGGGVHWRARCLAVCRLGPEPEGEGARIGTERRSEV